MTKREWLAAGILALAMGPASLVAAEETMEARIHALEPKLEAYIESGMKAFDDPGLAIGIVTGDKLVYAKGFGVGRKGGAPVNPDTIFQIGSTTKAFLATTLAIGVDKKFFKWDDRVVDRYPEFQLKDPWATQEFRLFDLLAQRSGLPPYVNDFVGLLGFDQPAMIRSLRGFPLLDGARGRPIADVAALAQALAALSRLAVGSGTRLLGVDINPMLVLPAGEGAWAADAVIELDGDTYAH